jgi:hypothetical protein
MMISSESLLNNLLAGPTSRSYHKQLHQQFLSVPLIQRLPVAFYSDGQDDESEERNLPKLKRDVDDAIPF